MDLHSEVLIRELRRSPQVGAILRTRYIVIDIVQNGVPTDKRLSQLQRRGGRPGPHTDVTEECMLLNSAVL